MGHIYSELRGSIARQDSVSSANLGEELNGDEMSLLVCIQQAPVSLTQSDRALQDYIKIIQERWQQRTQKDAPLDLRALATSQREKGKRYEGNG